MQIRLLRHATLLIQLAGVHLLVDPMLSPAGAMDPVQDSAHQKRIPMVELPMDAQALDDLVATLDGVLVTHLHRDHWDARAVELLPKHLPILCQLDDAERIRAGGFSTVLPIVAALEWHSIRFERTGGQHGDGEIGRKMAPVSGFVLSAQDEPLLYLAGDTIWCAEVAAALQTHAPDVIVVNAGAAEFLSGGPITMTAEDVAQVCRVQPAAKLIAVHMETINHCGLTRVELRRQLDAVSISEQVIIPDDGESVVL